MLDVIPRIGDKTDRILVVMLGHEFPQERRLAHSRLSGQDHEWRLVEQAVFQEAVGGAMRRSRIERFSIRQQREGFIPKPVK